MNIDDAIRLFIQLRDKEAAIEAEAEAQVNKLKEARIKLAGWLKEQADAQGVKQFKTASGTVFWKPVDFAQVADWDITLDFIRSGEYWDMLEHRVSKKAVRAFIDENGSIPPGITFGSRLEANVRRPTNRVEE